MLMLKSISLSLSDLLGKDYTAAAVQAAVYLGFMKYEEAFETVNKKIDFYPDEIKNINYKLLSNVGNKVIDTFENNLSGAPTSAFKKASNLKASPLSANGFTRIGEDGKLYFIGKSEHYHASLGHNFPGYKLIDSARRIGIPNATHNNTRGFITRLCERRIVSQINNCKTEEETDNILSCKESKILNRVINLETGSLAVEAGIKMMLSRFYKLDNSYKDPIYNERIPVFLVIGDYNNGSEANYHGTTVITQTMRGLWNNYYKKIEENDIYKIVPININDTADFENKIKIYNKGKYKTAGFLHEIILMNYGAIRLEAEFLHKAYKLCHVYDTPVLVDEIQSCMWYQNMFLFREYGLSPDFVVIGKGFPGGEYPASKIITTYEMDSLNLFGALVTNGQEELASLAYLITMEFSSVNSDFIKESSEYFHNQLCLCAKKYPSLIQNIEGLGFLCGIRFESLEIAAKFADKLNEMCIDISAQLYKINCPPIVLLKPPIISDKFVIDFLLGKIEKAADYITENFKI